LRGFTVSHESIRRWEAKLLPVMGEALRKRRHGMSGRSWYVRIPTKSAVDSGLMSATHSD
jgi:transposase-like protein